MLPYVIEYLLTLRAPGGKGFLVHQGASQTMIPIMPPNTEVVLNVFPLESDYFNIVYRSWIDATVVPNAFWGWGQYFGSRTLDGVITQGVINQGFDSFVFISESEPAIAMIRNLTPLNQYYAGMAFFISIATESDFNLVIDALRRLATSTQSEELAEQAINLLARMTSPRPPRPPEGGGP